MEAVRPASLRDTINDQIGAFLFKEGFANQPHTAEGIFDIINLLSDYQEEGKTLFPEVLITNELDLLNTIPDYKIEFPERELERTVFKKIIKDCAPMCNSEWVIYIEVKNNRIRYGLTCASITETTPSLYKQTVGDMKLDIPGCTVAYIRNIGKKTVELKGLRSAVLVALSLNDPREISINEIKTLAAAICLTLNDDIKETAINYIEKILSDGLKEGHGNLISVVENTEEAIENLKQIIPDGSYLLKPINLIELLQAFEYEKSAVNSVALRQHAAIIKSMCNNDGITVFTNDGRLIGYHLIIQHDYIPEVVKPTINGGARTRAFYNIKHSAAFIFGLIKSQDGPIQTFSTHE